MSIDSTLSVEYEAVGLNTRLWMSKKILAAASTLSSCNQVLVGWQPP